MPHFLVTCGAATMPVPGKGPASNREIFMRKTAKKKLVLAKETVRRLEDVELEKVAGQATTACTTYTNCCSGYATCATCGGQCGTRLC